MIKLLSNFAERQKDGKPIEVLSLTCRRKEHSDSHEEGKAYKI